MTHSASSIQNQKFPKYDRYKDSGVEWLGEVPEHWGILRAKHVFHNVSEKGFPNEPLLSATQDEGVVPRDQREQRVVTPIGQLESFKLVRINDFVISLRSFQGGIEHCAYRGLVSPAYTVLRLQRDVNPRYLRHLLKASNFISELNVSVTGIRQGKNIDYGEFAESFLPIPTKPEQDRIVAFLDQKTAEIDALIAKKQRQIELLDEQKAILINRAVTRGLNPNIKLKPSGIEWIGDIPEHWKVLRVKHQATYFTSGSRGWGDYYAEKGDLFLQSGDLTNNCTISLTNAKRVKLPRKAEGLRTRLQTNDTVVCITGANTGRVANVGEISETIYVNQHLCLVRPSKEIDHRYLSLALSGSAGRTHFSLCQYGLKEGLNLDDVKNCAFPVPPQKEQSEILEFINKINSSIEISKDAVTREIRSLKTLRSALIAHAVSGKIKI